MIWVHSDCDLDFDAQTEKQSNIVFSFSALVSTQAQAPSIFLSIFIAVYQTGSPQQRGEATRYYTTPTPTLPCLALSCPTLPCPTSPCLRPYVHIPIS